MIHPRETIPPRARLYASILREVSKETGVPLADILGRSAFKEHVRARRIAIFRMKEARPRISSPQLGAIFDRDHTTILHLLGRTKKGRRIMEEMRARGGMP